MIYLDNASTTKVNSVLANIIYNTMKSFGNPSNIYEIGKESKQMLRKAQEQVANVIGAEPEEIYFTSGATESNNLAINQREYCLCSPYEHHSVLKIPKVSDRDDILPYLKYLRQERNYPNIKGYFCNSKEYKSNCMISHMLVNNETGEIFDIKEMFDICNELGILTHTDATQAIGKIPVNVKELGAKMLSLSGHKFHCPKGIGVLYISKEINPIKPLFYGGHQQHLVRPGTENIPYIVGIGYGIEAASKKMEKFHNYSQKLKDTFLNQLNSKNIDYRLNSPENSIPSIISISFKNIEGEALGAILSDKEIYVGTGSACTTGDFEPSHVLKAMNVPDEYINGTLRISTGWDNTEEEMIIAANEIANAYNYLSKE